MNRPTINSYSTNITPSVSDVGAMEMLSEEEFYNISPTVSLRKDPKRLRTSENAIDMEIDTSYTSIPTEMLNLDDFLVEIKENLQCMLRINKSLFNKTVKQLKKNFDLLRAKDINDSISIFESQSQDEYEIEVMETELKKNTTKTPTQVLVTGNKIMIEETDKRQEKITDNKMIMTKVTDESTKICLLKSNSITEKSIEQLKESEYCWLIHVIQSDDIRNNPEWNHSVDLYPNSNSTNDETLEENTVFNRDCKEALITIETYSQAPDHFTILTWFLVRKDLMSRLRLFQKVRRRYPWFRHDINAMQVYGLKEDTILLKKLAIETRYNEDSHYKWLTVPTINVCLIVLGVALEEGFCPIHPQADPCTVSYKNEDTNISCKVGFCLEGKVRYAGIIGNYTKCIVDTCSNLARYHGKCPKHYHGLCSVEGCSNVVKTDTKCKKHYYGLCSVEGCSNVVVADTKCHKHYYGLCSVEGCPNVVHAKKQCYRHYYGLCLVQSCSFFARKKGKCDSHYYGKCPVQNCSNVAKKKGKCKKHYYGECSTQGCTNIAQCINGACRKHSK
jgi:hypothetical protein